VVFYSFTSAIEISILSVKTSAITWRLWCLWTCWNNLRNTGVHSEGLFLSLNSTFIQILFQVNLSFFSRFECFVDEQFTKTIPICKIYLFFCIFDCWRFSKHQAPTSGLSYAASRYTKSSHWSCFLPCCAATFRHCVRSDRCSALPCLPMPCK
jgi:hypothetical protein